MSLDKEETVYTEFHPKVSGYIKSRILHPQDAEDLVSAVFLKVYGALISFDESRASLSTWVYTITRNTVNDYFRRNGKMQPPEDIEELSLSAPEQEIPEEILLREENLDLLADSLAKLPQRERDMIILLYYHEKSLKETASLLQMSYGNAKYLHHIAINRLRSFMEKNQTAG